MASILGKKLQAIAEEARDAKEDRKSKWTEARALIMDVFREAQDGLEGSKAEERNGTACELKYGTHALQFVYNKAEHKVIRGRYRGVEDRLYDIDAIDRDSIESELKDFVRIVA